MTRIILVRHGHVDWLAPERFRGRAELPLSDLGRRQARAAADTLRRPGNRTPFIRARSAVAATPGPRLRHHFSSNRSRSTGSADIDYGEWQGLTRDQAQERWPDETELWFRAPHLAAIPGGETLAALLSRATAALRDILRRHPAGTVVLVGHDSVNRALLLFALELPLSRYWHLRQEPCAVNELFFEDGSFVIRSINETQHLAGL